MKKKRKSGTVFTIMGLLFIAAALLLSVYNIWDGKRAEQASMDITSGLQSEMEDRGVGFDEDGYVIPDSTAGMDPYSSITMFQDPDKPMETMELKGYKYIGIVEIPALKLKLPVMEEWDYTRLRVSPCRFSGSYYSDDLVIAAHNYARHFSPIKWIEPGTDVYFTNPSGLVLHYQVDYRETMQPTQVEDMIEAEDWDLTLFTCNTGGQTRCAVRCSRVE